MKNKGSLNVWCVGYWEDDKFKVPFNLYHLKFYPEDIFLFIEQLKKRLPNKDWISISKIRRIDLLGEKKLTTIVPVCENEITNDGQKETAFDFQS